MSIMDLLFNQPKFAKRHPDAGRIGEPIMRQFTVKIGLAVFLAFALMSAAVFSLEAWQVRSVNELALRRMSQVSGPGEDSISQAPQVLDSTSGGCRLDAINKIVQTGSHQFVLILENSSPLTITANSLSLKWPVDINGALRAVTLDDQDLWREEPVATSPARITFTKPGSFKPSGTAHFSVEFQSSKENTIAQEPYTFVITGSTLAGECVFQHVVESPLVRFKGPIQELPAQFPIGNWQIARRIVEVNDKTIISPLSTAPQLYDEADVAAIREGSKLVAIRINWEAGKNTPVALSGIITHFPNNADLPGTLVLKTTDSQTVSIQVKPTTRIITSTHAPGQGHYAAVLAIRERNSGLVAQRIAVETPEDRQKAIQFEAPIINYERLEARPAVWNIGGITVTLSNATIVTGERWVALGALAEVRGRREADSILANTIYIRPPSYLNQPDSVVFVTGTVVALPAASPALGEWTISSLLSGSLLKVKVDDKTRIDEFEAPAQPGARVELRVRVLQDGRLLALRVTVRRSATGSTSRSNQGLETPINVEPGRTLWSMGSSSSSLLSEIASEASDDAKSAAIARDSSGLLHLVYVIDTPQGPVLRFRYRQGTSWVTTPFEITNGSDPALTTDSRGRVHLAYTYETIDNTYRIQYRCRTPGLEGKWSLSYPRDSGISESLTRPRPAIAIGKDFLQYGGGEANPYITWAQSMESDPEIYYAQLRDVGQDCPDFTGASPIVNDPFQDRATGTTPSLAVDDHGRLHVVWQDFYNSKSEIFYSRWGQNVQGGWNWSNQYIISALGQDRFSGMDSQLPTVAVETGTGAAHLAWEQSLDNTGTSSQVYYTYDTSTYGYTPTWSALYLPFGDQFNRSHNPRLIFDSWRRLYLAWVEGRDIRLWQEVNGSINDWQEVALVAASAQGGTDSVSLVEPGVLIDSSQRCNQILHLTWAQNSVTPPTEGRSQIRYQPQSIFPSKCVFLPVTTRNH